MIDTISYIISIIAVIITLYVLTNVISSNSKYLREYFSLNPPDKLQNLNYHVFDWEPIINNRTYFNTLNDTIIANNINSTISSIMQYKYDHYFQPKIIYENHKNNLKMYFTDNVDEVDNELLNVEVSNIERILHSYLGDKRYENMIGDILLNIIDETLINDELHIYFLPFISKNNNIVNINYKGNNLIFIGLYTGEEQTIITYPRWEQGLIKLDLNIALESQLDCKGIPIEPKYSHNEKFLDTVCNYLYNALGYKLNEKINNINITKRYIGIDDEYSYMESIETEKYKLPIYENIITTMKNNLYYYTETIVEYNKYLKNECFKRNVEINDDAKLILPNYKRNYSFI